MSYAEKLTNRFLTVSSKIYKELIRRRHGVYSMIPTPFYFGLKHSFQDNNMDISECYYHFHGKIIFNGVLVEGIKKLSIFSTSKRKIVDLI